MRAVVLVEPGRTEVQDVVVPEAESVGNALVRVQTAGLCGTDSSIVAGKIPAELPRIMGHEAVGTLEIPGRLGSIATGQRVLIDPAISCEICDLCRRGYPNICRNGGLLGRDFDGVFAEYVSIDEKQLLVVPDSIGSNEAGILQVLGTCVHATSTASVRPGDIAVVLGLGVGGQLIAQLLTKQGATVIGVTRSEWKRDLAMELGIHAAVPPNEVAELVDTITSGRGANLVVEAVGTEATFAQAIELAGAAATVVLFGTATGGNEGLPYYQLYFKELTIMNPRAATKADYERAIELVAAGTINGAPIVSASFGLSDAQGAFDAVKESTTLKVLIDAS
ncbi:MAG: threonine dehydrogenase-like Zn-dependent dehydrogenase [Verrucomicrobiales bacterium]|jgi:threonine dehydrogenase-like Zn-dependent dehydrogenase